MARRRDDNGIFQLALADVRCKLALRMKLTQRASVSVVFVFDRRGDRRDGTFCRTLVNRGRDRGRPVCMLTTEQSVQALPEQHHPRIENEHSAGDERLQASEHGS